MSYLLPIFTYKTADTWETVERYKPGLWCDIIGDKIALTLPSASVRQLSDPTMTMKIWDSVVSAHIDLLGKDPSNGRGQWVVTDEQPSIGYMHSGYQIVTHLDMADPNKEGAMYDKWCTNPGIALLVYAQLARDFGWGTYKSVFRTYDKIPKDKRPSNQQEKENMWIQTFFQCSQEESEPRFRILGDGRFGAWTI
ncbi:Hypothetical predicted protein [Mytilus galloprovincialis]|uniref:Peptidase M60 domain-containing protein n=1 Tax=Mytilus galloprovincialis TaxID=29158 RepID=A0A8B6EEJ0_MYTGA|nr:Hypothetical predicted protein [Mytilus galloprovincialis]